MKRYLLGKPTQMVRRLTGALYWSKTKRQLGAVARMMSDQLSKEWWQGLYGLAHRSR